MISVSLAIVMATIARAFRSDIPQVRNTCAAISLLASHHNTSSDHLD